MKRQWIAAAFAGVLAISGSAAAYGATTLSAAQIDPETLEITGLGDAHTTPDRMRRDVLLKAAEETEKRGFDLFLMVDASGAAPAGSAARPEEKVLLMLFRGSKPTGGPANLYRASDVLDRFEVPCLTPATGCD